MPEISLTDLITNLVLRDARHLKKIIYNMRDFTKANDKTEIYFVQSSGKKPTI